jgi:membrane protein
MVTRGTTTTTLDFAKSIWRRTSDHNIFGAAAELAYYFMLALFPMLIFLTSLLSSLSGARKSIFDALSQVMPPDAMGIVNAALDDAISKRSGGLISIGILGTIWAASAGVSALTSTLNTVFDVKETRSYWRVKAISVGLTLALSLLVVVGVLLVMFGDRFGSWVAERLQLGGFLTVGLAVLNYLVGFGLLLAGLQVTYYFGPNKKRQWRWVTPGAFAAVVAALIVSIGFSIYLRFAPSYSATYGSLGAVVVLMLWLYLMGLMIMLGAEIDSQSQTIEKQN